MSYAFNGVRYFHIFRFMTETIPIVSSRIKFLGGSYVKSFMSCNPLLAPMFSLPSENESLRDLIVTINAHDSKAYHLDRNLTH